MARKDFWKSDWFLGVAVAVVVLVISQTDFVQSMGRKAYDLGVLAPHRIPRDRVAVIAIDDNGIANIGRRPWSRDVQLYPSLPLQIAARSLNLGVADIKAQAGEGVTLGKLNIRSDPSFRSDTR